MRNGARVAVIIPALNEERSIGKVIGDIPEWVDSIIVADNGNLPMWHRFLPVGNWKKTIEYKPEEISRTMHLPQDGTALTDRAIPIRILAEFLHDRNRRYDLVVVPNAGDTLEYAKWLDNDIVYGPGRAVKYRPSEPKDTTLKEYYTYMRFCQENTTYKSLTYNGYPVDDDKVMPGDIFVAYNERGNKGVAYVVLHMLTNDKNEKLYCVGTGCEKACNFHIPLFNNDRHNPWLTADQIGVLGIDYPHSGFFRLRIH